MPCGGVQQEGRGLEDDGDANVQVPVGHVVIQHARSFLATHRAPEEAGGIDAHAEDKRRRDEACRADVGQRSK